MDRDPLDLIGHVLEDEFRVDELAGEGDLSVVYRGRQLFADTPVAIKCLDLPESLDAALVEPLVTRFREASRLHHRLARANPNIAQVLSNGSTVARRSGAQVPYLVREWFDGVSLGAELARRRAEGLAGRSVEEAIALLGPAVEGVAYAHAQGVVHLSLNPSNLFLANPSAGTSEKSVKVVDFGVARALNEVAPDVSPEVRIAAGLRVLYPEYAAPEQHDAAGGPVGAWTDVYALALVLMEVISDRAVATREDPTPNTHGIDVPGKLEVVLTRALARAPRRRQHNARAFWNDVTSAARRGVWGAGTAGAVPSKPSLAPSTPRMEGVTPVPARMLMPTPARELTPTPVFAPVLTPVAAPTPAPSPALTPSFTPSPSPSLTPSPSPAPAIPAPSETHAPPATPAPPTSAPLRKPGRLASALGRLARRRVPLIALIGSVSVSLVLAIALSIVAVRRPVAVVFVAMPGPETTEPGGSAATIREPPAAATASGSAWPAASAAATATSTASATDPAAASRPPEPFHAAAAKLALDAAAANARQCRRGPWWGTGTAHVTFASDGTVSQVAIAPPFRGMGAGQCVASLLSGATMPPFAGKSGVCVYRFSIPQK